MTIAPAARRKRSPVRFATPYLEVERRPTSSLERTIMRELAQANHAVKRKKPKGGDRPNPSRGVRLGTSRQGARSPSTGASRA